jgi:hypothetical protein
MTQEKRLDCYELVAIGLLDAYAEKARRASDA